jgi:23S rRNA (adenine2503-C2)-methyltransferase
MTDEVRLIQADHDCKITNIVFMGMGEPLMNLREVITAIEMCSSPLGLSIGQRHTTVSTAGLIDGMRNLLNTQIKVKLAISLNFPDEDMRSEMMPVNRNNPLKEILQLAREYSVTRGMVTFEYVLIARMNDSINHARRLLSRIRGIPSKINLIPYNPVPSLPYKRPSQKTIDRFYQYLLNSHHTVTLRKSKGIEIHAACGQLSSINQPYKEGKNEKP